MRMGFLFSVVVWILERSTSTRLHLVYWLPHAHARSAAQAQSGMGDEGYWGDFVVDEDDRRTSHEINLTPILDAMFLSDKEVLACGLNLRPSDEKPNSHFKDAGVILRSFDIGKSWQSIYRSRSYETFFFLTKAKDNEFMH